MAFVFTKAGLVAVDLDEGKLLWSIPFRSRLFESVNASTPIVVKDVVLVSATYGTGSLAIRIKPTAVTMSFGEASARWTAIFPI